MSKARKAPEFLPSSADVAEQLLQPFDLSGSMYHGQQFTYDRARGYVYLPQPDGDRRVVMFQASQNTGHYLQLASREERLVLSWRKSARGPGFYGGNTPLAAASSMVVSKNAEPRAMQVYLTNAIDAAHIVDRREDPTYFMPMVQAQFSTKKGKAMVERRMRDDGDDILQILSPGLVSRAKTDGFVRGKLVEDQAIEPTWLRLVAQPAATGTQTIECIGQLEGAGVKDLLTIEQGITHQIAFAAAALKRVVGGALSR